MNKLFLFFSLFFFFYFLSSKIITIDPISRNFKDEYGRSLFYHGVNAVYKTFPFIPITDHFHPDLSLSDEDFVNLKNWGMNFIRLHTPWDGIEPIKDQYNETLIQELKKLVKKAANYNITILLDAHQDLLSKKFCGEGFPDWAIFSNSSFPSPVRSSITRDEFGYPLLNDCLSIVFGKYYFSYDIARAFEDFYDNINGIADKFADFWAHIALNFKDEENVIGYEIINEPFIGDLYHNLKELWPGYTDYHKLQPLYQRVHEKIRKIDNKTAIFFESNPFGITKPGFTQGPGGEEYRDRQVYSYHVYCGMRKPSSKFDNLICKPVDWIFFDTRVKNANELGILPFLTEFGAYKDSIYEINEIDHVVSKAESLFHSWAYWQYKGFNDITTAGTDSDEGFFNVDGSLQYNKVKVLARSYVYALCGNIVKNEFKSENGDYNLEFKYQNCKKNSEIYLSEEFYYKNGFNYEFDGCKNCFLKKKSEKFYYEIEFKENVQINTLIKLKIRAK